ncbi:MAG: hypothetical protein COT71_02680 [Candidatus Andersenbacteria bacterium CG10_big_fil_rev_8_21_14_0_10_54_11]|uniref:Uncharacterized protein n=1 Tax=Candidatus Andersenbacteria bacterium CG10_big_fil_rev_8_21_14_0_10_54_11 TaxID=1974485 RepID=A0A2M6WZ85_9BACT|nr:MAG: hypothetical protein COT71_02680 [Candidatus Andersenbacteria bacterium CG10_big_fil_rev_8_21_14_0_10_54_11]
MLRISALTLLPVRSALHRIHFKKAPPSLKEANPQKANLTAIEGGYGRNLDEFYSLFCAV